MLHAELLTTCHARSSLAPSASLRYIYAIFHIFAYPRTSLPSGEDGIILITFITWPQQNRDGASRFYLKKLRAYLAASAAAVIRATARRER